MGVTATNLLDLRAETETAAATAAVVVVAGDVGRIGVEKDSRLILLLPPLIVIELSPQSTPKPKQLLTLTLPKQLFSEETARTCFRRGRFGLGCTPDPT